MNFSIFKIFPLDDVLMPLAKEFFFVYFELTAEITIVGEFHWRQLQLLYEWLRIRLLLLIP